MKIGIITESCQNLPEIDESFDVFIVLGNFLPVFDKRLVTWNIINQVDYIDNIFNPWLGKVNSKYKLILGGMNDHLAQFYGSQSSFYLAGDYIQDDLITISGINFYGMPWVPSHYYDKEYLTAFKSREGNFFSLAVDSIHQDTDVLITNTPPKLNFLSENTKTDGDIFLSKKIESLKNIKIHMFSLPCDVDINFERTINHKSVCCSQAAFLIRKFITLEI